MFTFLSKVDSRSYGGPHTFPFSQSSCQYGLQPAMSSRIIALGYLHQQA